MPTASSRLTPIRAAVAASIAILVLVIVAAGFGRPADAASPSSTPAPTPTLSPSPSPTAIPTPIPSPTPNPTASPSPAPSDPSDDGPIPGDVTVDLQAPAGHHVTATVRDDSGDIGRIQSGVPGDGMSVRWHDIAVKNVDAHTVSVTWVGITVDENVFVGVSADGDGYVVDIVQRGLDPNSDTLGSDRVLLLTFDQPVRASDVTGGVADRSVD
jgi:hypothetical protein